MDPLTTNDSFIDPSSISPWPTIMRYGLIGGLALIIYSLVGILTGWSSPANMMGAILFTLILIIGYAVLMVIAVKNHRNENLGGNITVGRAFMVAFFSASLAALILAVFNTIYMGIIDPEYMMRLADDLIAFYEGFGMSEDQVEQAIIDAGADKPQTFLSAGKNQASGYIFGAIIGAIIAIVIAAIMKKDEPQIA